MHINRDDMKRDSFISGIFSNFIRERLLESKILTVLEPRCNRAAWVRSGFEPQELIDVQLERQLTTRYLHDVILASTKLLYTTSFYQSLGFIAAKYRIEFLFEV